MRIDHAGIDDAESILSLQKLAYQSEAALYNDPMLPPLRQTLAEIKAEIGSITFLKATVDHEIVGSVRASMRNGACHIGRLMVHPQMQRQGIGRALMHSIEWQHPMAERFQLFTGSRSKANIRLYQRLGYEIYPTEALSGEVTLVHMQKRVGEL